MLIFIVQTSQLRLQLLNSMVNLLILLICLLNIQSMRIPCEFVATTWNPELHLTLSERQIVVSTLYNFDMIVDSIDGSVSQTIINSGTWQASNIHLIAYFLKPSFKVLNLGSQTGLQAILIGNLIGKSGELHIFEPYSVSYNIVKKNVYLNNLEDITKLYQVGASDIQTRAKMLIDKQNTGGAQIFITNTPTYSQQRGIIEEYVQVDLVDEVLPEGLVIDFVLMDVEKMEVQALLGMKKLIERSKNIIILLEWQYMANSKRSEAKTMRLLNSLKQLEFNIYKYEESEQNRCEIGTFQQIMDVYELLKMPVQDIIIVPKHIDPSNYKQQ